jgi:hypothetical protein
MSFGNDFDAYPENVPRVFIDGKHVVLRIGGDDLMFPYDIWDATVRYIKDLRSGKEVIPNGTIIRTLPKQITWEDKFPNA